MAAKTDGVDFPIDADGKRSSTATNQGAFIAAVKAHDEEAHKAVAAEKKWRFGYIKHVVKQVQVATRSEASALGIARDGLAYLHKTMEFVRDGETHSLEDAMKKFTSGSFETHVVKGEGKERRGLEVPYNGKVITGQEIRAQAEEWVRKGVIEFDTGAALCLVADNPDWSDLSDFTFVLFGAGSAMGPYPLLMALGAHVVALDLDRPGIWTRLLKIARESPGKLTLPLRKPASPGISDEELAKIAGCNLLTETPEVRNWLLTVEPSSKLVLGGYCYLDGPLFVRVSMAMDAIIGDLVQKRESKPSLAYLCTPTDVHVCTPTSKAAAADNLRKSPAWQQMLAPVMGMMNKKFAMTPNQVKGETPESLPLVNAIVGEQGPNYLLAKRLQHWRSILSRKEGCIVSTNIAPSTATASVVSNKSFALAYNGMKYFRPMEVFQPDTSNAVMTALLCNDLKNPHSHSHPGVPLKNPMQLFAATSFHGGAWRCGYKFGCLGPPAIIGYVTFAYLVKSYLILYSLIQLLGWTVAMLTHFTGSPVAPALRQALLDRTVVGGSSPDVLWDQSLAISFLTYFQLMEVVHAFLGFVPSNPLMTGMQISSRVAVAQTLDCLLRTKEGVSSFQGPWLYCMITAWTITEVIRYAYYVVNTAGLKIPPLTWLRYSTFLVLYPLGVSGELGCFWNSISPLASSTGSCGLYSECGIWAKLTNMCGFWAILFVYVTNFPSLFGMMLKQRKKNVGGAGKTSAAKKNA
eukprot:gnl/TRDRNA2_/TRDRNA2_181295_c0_seq1.p1 gnl/TRDRNA2_/TRDRNA2_181295_c0~~gnl/TRDRNA2_/TRDRNA2_181295_c0_seq1.p1  ORF type:complete len:746 (+),score=134.38 gnl/TRDRNA2_/TRDRNA2_181295_c0_seq1:64-2301(+)